jgi:Txe/YoeB family toxin of toxin-antitoxin system
MYKIYYTKQALKDIKKIKNTPLEKKAKEIIALLQEDPFTTPPSYEKLLGDLSGAYSRRINIQHRIVYEVFEELQSVKILRMWSHYGE